MTLRTPYDEVPYRSYSHFPSHPDQLSTVALLHGVTTPAAPTARVLEFGCGEGENAIGIGYALPSASVVGVDLAPSAIERGRRAVGVLGLDNVDLQVADVRDLTVGQLGEFDYVIAHGLYAWVDLSTRDALMAACASHLAPEGIAYVSFNTHPGGHFRRAMRELAQWHAGPDATVEEQAERARSLFSEIARTRDTSDAYGRLLASELPDLGTAPNDRLVHDLLGADWRPVWFAEFAADAANHGLQYVGEASFPRFTGPWAPDAERDLWNLAGGDRTGYHQLMDFMVWRRFRDSLLCHTGRIVEHHFEMTQFAALGIRLGGPLAAIQGETSPALEILAEALPHPMAFTDLAGRLGSDQASVAAAVLDLARGGRVTVHSQPPALGEASTGRPAVSAVARRQAASGSSFCSTRLGWTIKMDGEMIRMLLGLLDGTRDREQVRVELASQGAPPLEPEQFDRALEELAAMALLDPESEVAARAGGG